MVARYLDGSKGSDVLGTKKALVVIIILQYIPRFLRFVPLSSDLKKTAGVFAETAWAGAAYYLLWFVLASHVSNFSSLFIVTFGSTVNCFCFFILGQEELLTHVATIYREFFCLIRFNIK